MRAKKEERHGRPTPRVQVQLLNYSNAVRGKYHQRLSKEGANVVILEPDVAKAFPDSAAVNDALRALLQIARSSQRPAARSSRPTRKGVAA